MDNMNTLMTVREAAQFLRTNGIIAGLPLTREPVVACEHGKTVTISKRGFKFRVTVA